MSDYRDQPSAGAEIEGERRHGGEEAPPGLRLVMDRRDAAEIVDAGHQAAGEWAMPSYVHTRTGISRYTVDKKHDKVLVPLSNWTARIVADVTRDDGGSSPTRTFGIEARQAGRTGTVEVTLEQLSRVREWSLKALGATAQISVHPSVQDHLLLAVQQASSAVQERVIFAHSGWREVEGESVFLHGAGAIGSSGAVPGVEVDLPRALSPMDLSVPAGGREEVSAVRAALDLLELADDGVMAVVLGATWRAPLGETPLTVWVTGPTGAGKTELTAVAQQHFGAGFDAQHLPAAWSGTANSINELAYLSKDLLLTVDDFVPKGPASTVARLHSTAETVIRAQGNGAGRSRLTADANLRESRPPRGTLLASGEDIPQGQSLRARMLVVDLGPGALDFARLTDAQRAGRGGTLATAMGGYIRWLAGHPARRMSIRDEVEHVRSELLGTGSHKRTASLVAEVAVGWRTLLDYAVECAAVSKDAAEALWVRVFAALKAVGEQQTQSDADADPAVRFLELVAAALSSGRAHLAAVDGTAPAHPGRWGWRADGHGFNPPWRAQGIRIGWVEGNEVFLTPDVVMEVVRADSAEPIAVSTTTLGKRLHERGHLAATEQTKRGTLTTRKTVQGRRVNVWSLRAEDFGADPAGSA